MISEISLSAVVPHEDAGSRLDQVAAYLFPDYSRSRIQAWIKNGQLSVNGAQRKQTSKLVGGEFIEINALLEESEGEWQAEAIPLEIIHEDSEILVLNKPAGLVVHPAPGNRSGTLLNGLLHYCESLGAIPRAGIVHRLDKDTSGLMVVAKTLRAQNSLVKQLQSRSVSRVYRALSVGGPDEGGRVAEPIGRHPRVRTKMAVVKSGGKEAITHYELLQTHGRFRDIRVKLETGRTHQIRVHMAWLGFPLLGDPTYAKKLLPLPGEDKDLIRIMAEFPRQALHAESLSLEHPVSAGTLGWHSPLPLAHQALLDTLEAMSP